MAVGAVERRRACQSRKALLPNRMGWVGGRGGWVGGWVGELLDASLLKS